MKVLHFYRTYFPETQGGLEEAIRQICLATKSHGVENRILTLAWAPDPEIIDFPEGQVIRCRRQVDPASCSIGVAAFSKFQEQLQWADVVNLHFPWPFADLVHLICRNRLPTVVTYHSDIVRQKVAGALYAPLRDIFLDRVDQIVATSQNYVDSSATLQKFLAKTQVIPLGLDEASYPLALERHREEVGAIFGRNFFFFIGVLRYYKGLRFLLDAMRDAPYDLVIAGSGSDEQELKKRAKDLDLSNVHFAGRVSNARKAALFAMCRGVVFPSHLRSEAFGVTLIEGAMFSRPLISCEIGTGTSYVNLHGSTGYVVPPSDPSTLRRAMDQIWGNPQEAEVMGRRARERYERLFSGDALGRAYATLYTALSEAKK